MSQHTNILARENKCTDPRVVQVIEKKKIHITSHKIKNECKISKIETMNQRGDQIVRKTAREGKKKITRKMQK
jgi:hypothetical protein